MQCIIHNIVYLQQITYSTLRLNLKLTNILRLNKNANYEIDVVGLDHHASDLISIPPLNY